jgi:hypothetical protein
MLQSRDFRDCKNDRDPGIRDPGIASPSRQPPHIFAQRTLICVTVCLFSENQIVFKLTYLEACPRSATVDACD